MFVLLVLIFIFYSFQEAVPAEASRAKEIDNVGEDRTEDPQPETKNNADSGKNFRNKLLKDDNWANISVGEYCAGNEANRENTYNVTCPASEENASAENDNTAQPMPVKIRRPRKRDIISTAELEKKAIVLPEGSPLMMVADVEWQAEDAGPVLQFLEFCSTFSKVKQLSCSLRFQQIGYNLISE